MEDKIFITLEEYKELLIIKGKYEELKSQQVVKPNWTYRDFTTTFDGKTMLLNCNVNKQREI